MSITLRRPRVLALTAAAIAFSGVAALPSPASAAPVTGVHTAVAPEPGLVTALTGLGVKIGLTGAATADPGGRFVFPVTGGTLSAALKGKVNHTGGIQFTPRSGLKFGIQSFVIDTTHGAQLTAIPTVAGFPLGIRVPVASITDLAVRTEAPATVVAGTLKFTDIGAFYVNTFLGKAAVKKGTVLGQAEATVTLGGAS